GAGARAGPRRARYLNALLANPLAVYLGKLSYLLYLWHWPVLFALRKFQLGSDAWLAAGLALTLLLAIPTHYLIEQPLRTVRWPKGKTIAILFLLPIVLLGALVAAAKKTDNFARFYPEAIRNDYLQAGHTVFKTRRADRCWSKRAITSAADCSAGDLASNEQAVFLGDSHGYQLIDFVDRLGKDHHLRIHDMTFTMCAPVADSPAKAGDPTFQPHSEACRDHNQQMMRHILARPEIKVVIMSAIWDLYANPASGSAGTPPAPSLHGYLPGDIDRLLSETITTLQAAGKRVVLFDDAPILPPELENCASNKLFLPHLRKADCSYPQEYARANHAVAAAILEGLRQRHPALSFVHTYDIPCDGQRCQSALQGVPLYAHNDRGHLGAGGSALYYDAYLARRPQELAGIFGKFDTAPPALAASAPPR
ncbi:acyltransferase, partial [Oxalobacteraceae bacterium]|nr:acyltransferase [Oxalobacteraceae bacterium]